jgi:isoquinoline 1-oxidoreductase beta subunit
VFVSIAKDGTVTLFAHRAEMGQGIRTGLTMILADELEADWARVKVEQADGDEKYGDQYTDGSRSIVKNYQRLREFGATARRLLEQAAAKQLGVDVSEVTAQNHKVVHAASGKSLDYGELVEAANFLPVPDVNGEAEGPQGLPLHRQGVPIVACRTSWSALRDTIDIRLPGPKYASVGRCPVVLGKFASYDASETLKVPPPTAGRRWGRGKLKVDWDLGENTDYDTDAARKDMETTASKPGDPFHSSSNAETAFAAAGGAGAERPAIRRTSCLPMEPPGAVADVKSDKVEVWSSTQDGQAAQAVVAEALGIDKANVTSHVPLLGGAFGRKSKPDFAAEAALISRAVGAPVKVTWMREDDIRHGYYHSSSMQYVKATTDDRGKATAWLHRSVFPRSPRPSRPMPLSRILGARFRAVGPAL